MKKFSTIARSLAANAILAALASVAAPAVQAASSTSCAFLAILRVYQICRAAGEAAFAQEIMIVVGLFSMAVAAWFGLLVTAINLLPMGQLDGGHVTYAVLGRFSRPIALATFGLLIVLGLTVFTSTRMALGSSWFVEPSISAQPSTNPIHPRSVDESVGRKRQFVISSGDERCRTLR